LADRVLGALTAPTHVESRSPAITPNWESDGATNNFEATMRQLNHFAEDNFRKKFALLGKLLSETLTAQEAVASAHKKAVFTAHTAAAKASHTAAMTARRKRRPPVTDQPRITAWIHPSATKRTREEDDEGDNDLAETGPLSQWLTTKRNGTRAVQRWSEKE